MIIQFKKMIYEPRRGDMIIQFKKMIYEPRRGEIIIGEMIIA
jgi:hypothetical protein